MTSTAPKTYVSTYQKYQNGSLEGKWVNLDQFDNAENFIKYCRELFNDEEEPEFMFQDWENVPDFISSESMNERKLERLFEFLSMNESEKSIIVAYVDATGNWETDFQDIFDSYYGSADSEAEFAEEYTREHYSEAVKKLPNFIVIDWQETWNQWLQHEFYVGEDNYDEKHFFHQI